MHYTAHTAAEELGTSVPAIRKAIQRGKLRTLPIADTAARISEQEVERYRRRKRLGDSSTVSWDLDELPEVPWEVVVLFEESDGATIGRFSEEQRSNFGGRLIAQQLTTYEPPHGMIGDPEVLVRAYSQGEHSPASAVIVVGDLLRGTPGLAPESLPLVINDLFDSVADKLPENTTIYDVAWVLATGAVDRNDHDDPSSLFSVTVAPRQGKVAEFTAQLVPTAAIDRVIEEPLETWPNIYPDNPHQQRQWRKAITHRDRTAEWIVDPGDAEGPIITLGRLHAEVERNPTPRRRQFVAHVADYAQRVIQLLDSYEPRLFTPWLEQRINVPVRRWEPSQEQRERVAQLAQDWDETQIRECYDEGLAWLRSVDDLSDTPDASLASILDTSLSRLRFINQPVEVDLPAPPSMTVDELVLSGDTAEEWVSTLHPVRATLADNSQDARAVRALRRKLTAIRSATREQISGEYRDEAGVYCTVTEDHTLAFVLRPRTTEGLDTTGATVQAHRDATGGDLAVFLRLNTGILTLLPHHNKHSGVSFGYTGTGPRNLAADIVYAYPQARQPSNADDRNEEEARVRATLRNETLMDLDIQL